MSDKNYALRQGTNLFGLLQGLKRRPEHAAKDLRVDLEVLERALAGEPSQEKLTDMLQRIHEETGRATVMSIGAPAAKGPTLSPELVRKLVKTYPLNERDLFPLHDDAPTGVKTMLAEESEATSRVMQRPNNDGELADYYDYRDTITTHIALFRPEWIQELHIVETNDPAELADTQWNNGHFEHQFTYFVGPVNFYYMEGGEKKVAVMNTGDSMYITPFVPHTFATRKNDDGELGLILALTYGDKISGDTQAEFAAIGRDLARQFALDFSTQEKAFASLVKHYMDAGSVTVAELAERSGQSKSTIDWVLEGDTSEGHVLNYAGELAKALRVNVRDLLPPVAEPKVVIHPYSEARSWDYGETDDGPAYKMVELAPVRNLPGSKGLEITVLSSDDRRDLDLVAPSHQYVYNAGDEQVELMYVDQVRSRSLTDGVEEVRTELLNPGDSAYIKPFVPHGYATVDEDVSGKLLVLRIGGRVGGEAMRQLSMVDDADRAIAETTPWFQDKVE